MYSRPIHWSSSILFSGHIHCTVMHLMQVQSRRDHEEANRVGIEDTGHKALEIPLGNLSWSLDAEQCKCFAFRSPIMTYQCVIVHPLACIYPLKPEINIAPKHSSKAQAWIFGISLRSISTLEAWCWALSRSRLLLFANIACVARYGPYAQILVRGL